MKSPELHGRRIMLRNWRIEEAPRFVELTEDPYLIFGDMPYPYLLEHAEWWIKAVETHEDKHYFAIHGKEVREIVGFCWITLQDNGEDGLIVYALGKEFRMRGYATEAVLLMKDFAFGELGLKKLVAETHHLNYRSHRVLKKAGLVVVREETGGHKCRVTGNVMDKWFWESEDPLIRRHKGKPGIFFESEEIEEDFGRDKFNN